MKTWPLILLLVPAALRAQTWDDPATRELVDRGVGRRALAFADSSLRDWTARAHGFVFFLGQIGEGLSEPPRLIKADQLELEVYWRTPNLSKQRIIGWRDRRDLPTDISYHRDHLGIAMNNFPDLIRLGEGDEVRDVPHPVSPAGSQLYEYALNDSLTITLPDRRLRVYEVKFRPKDFRAPRIVGSVFFEVSTADLVRMEFSFTRAAYIDQQLEDITVSIENSLWSGTWWLPNRQEIEIRRRATFLDFPARGIIRGRFEIEQYQFNTGLADALFRRGPEIVSAPLAERQAFSWTDSLDAAIRDMGRPASLRDFDEVRAEATAMAMGHVLTGLRQRQLSGGSISDFAHVNRVEGLSLGAGLAARSADEARELRLRAGMATTTGLVTGGAALQQRRGPTTWRLAGFREIRELGDIPVISRVVNSIFAQEGGRDYGDYWLATGGSLGMTRALGGRGSLRIEGGYERVDSLVARATWARGAYKRPNPGADEKGWGVGRVALRRQPASFAATRDLSGQVELEGGAGGGRYARLFGELRWQVPAGSGAILTRLAAGAGTEFLPRHRGFVLGGKGTLPGEPFRRYGGRYLAWSNVEWQLPVRVPEIRMGSFAGTGRGLTLAPNISIGWTGGGMPGFFADAAGLGASPTHGPVVSIGIGASWLHDLLRFDLGYGTRSGGWEFGVDVSRVFWRIL